MRAYSNFLNNFPKMFPNNFTSECRQSWETFFIMQSLGKLNVHGKKNTRGHNARSYKPVLQQFPLATVAKTKHRIYWNQLLGGLKLECNKDVIHMACL